MQRETGLQEARWQALFRFVAPALVNDKAPLDFKKIDEALAVTASIFAPEKFAEGASIIGVMTAVIDKWKGEPATAARLLELRKELLKIRYGLVEETPANDVGATYFRNVSDAIFATLPPLYERTLMAVWKATAQLEDIEIALEQNPRTNVDDALRELKRTLLTVNKSFKDAGTFGRYLFAADAMWLRAYLVARAIRDITSWKSALLDHFFGPKDGPWRRSKTADT